MAEKLFKNVLLMENSKIEINEKKAYNLNISSARVTNACLMADVSECVDGQSVRVDVVYNKKKPEVIDVIVPNKGERISINITEELNCLIKFAFQCSGNPEHDDKIILQFTPSIKLENIDLFVEYIPEQIMHENSAYVDYDVRKAGSGKINLATGSLRFNHQCGSEVGLVYNNWQTEKRSTTVYDVHDKKTKFRHGVGKGFKLSVEQFLIKREGTESQSVYTYVDGDGNYHEFSEKYYYLNNKEQKVFVPKSKVHVDLDGSLKYVIDKKHTKEIKVERKTTNGLFLEQDFAGFKHAQYLEDRQKEQIELEENVASLERQLKQYVIVNKTTGNKLASGGELSQLFSPKTGKLSIASYESFLNAITAGRLVLTESEAIQYSSLLLQQTIKSSVLTAELEVKDSSYSGSENYSDEINGKSGKNVFKANSYNKMLINLRKLVSDLRKDYATLTKKAEYAYSNISSHYQYDAYVDYLKDKGYNTGNCCIDIDSLSRSGKLTSNENNKPSTNNLTIKIGHIKSQYCDLQLEMERINDDIDAYYRSKESETADMKVRQKVVSQRLRLFQQEFSDRTDKLQANINKFEDEIQEFADKLQGELTNRQIVMMLENSKNNKVDLEKYFKQYYNSERELTQMLWQMPKYYITGNEGVTMGFNKDGYLVMLFDNYENQTDIIYSKGRISSVQDTDNNIMSFEYGKDKRIKKIVNFDGKTYQLTYGKEKTSYGLLTQIVDDNGEITYLGYDKYGFLNSVEDNDKFGIAFDYDKYGHVITVRQTSEIKSVTDEQVDPAEKKASRTLAKINYHDSHLTTSVTDTLGLVKTYNFDIVGNVVTMYEGKYVDPEETTVAKSFEYVDDKRSFSIADNLSADNLITKKLSGSLPICLGTTSSADKVMNTKDITITEIGKGMTDLVFSVWAKANSAYVESERSLKYVNNGINKLYGIKTDTAKANRKFEVRAEVHYKDGTKNEQPFVACFDWLNIDWQYLALPIEIDVDKEFEDCVITLDYTNNTETAEFDCLALRQGSWTYCTFDDDGKKLTEEDSAGKTVKEYTYDDKGRVIKETITYKSDLNLPEEEKRRYTSTYEYNAQGSLVRTIDYSGVVKETVFDDKGREIKNITYNLDDPTSKFYEESKRDDKGKVTADIDESGEYDSVTYTYDQNGEVAVQTDGKGNKTAYGYKEGNLVSISGSTDGEESINTMHYNASLLTKVSNGGTVYNYEYDGWGRSTHVKIARDEKFSIETEYTDEHNSTIRMADGTSITSKIDTHGNTIKQTVKYSETLKETVENAYDKETGKLTDVSVLDKDKKTVYTIEYKHDHKGNLTSETHTRKSQKELVKKCKYNADNELESTTYEINGGTPFEYIYETDRTPDKRDAKVVLPFGLNQILAYDGLGRTKEVALGDNLVKDIYYAKYGDHATNRVNAVWHGVNGIRKENTRYTYDKAGNIETVIENGKLVARYQYDGLNRLVREDNVHFGTFTYQYDVAGNILSKTEYAFTTKDTLGEIKSVKGYSYKQHGWQDQLLAYNYIDDEGNDVEESFVYNDIGNPDTYRGRELAWQGRRLTKFTHGTKFATYTYDFNGMRAGKTSKDDGTNEKFNVKYIYDGNNLIAEQRNEMLITYFYGVDGVAGFEYDNDTYLYRKNVQGDITHIYKSSDCKLEPVAQYVYDAWGNHEILDAEGKVIAFDAKNIAHINPFRYRGYYFDSETNFYYLQTRYYDPELGRFISADSIEYLEPETLGGLNLYAYCGNNPVMNCDPTGEFFLTCVLVGLIAGAIIGAAVGGAVAYNNAVESGATGWDLVGQTLLGVVEGAVIGGAIGAAIGAVVGYVGPAIGNFLGSSFQFVLPALEFGGEVLVASTTITLTGAQIAAGVGAVALGSYMFAEHTNNKRPSTKNKHQKGQTQRQREKFGGEKGDARRPYHKWKRGAKMMFFVPIIELISRLFYRENK